MRRRGREWAWWNLPSGLKQILQRERLAGKYGGDTAAGVGKAPYFWAQEYGEDKAMIPAQGFATRSWDSFYTNRRTHLREAVRNSLVQ